MKLEALALSLLILAGCSKSGSGIDPASLSSSAHGARTASDEPPNSIDVRISNDVRQAMLDEASVGPDAETIQIATREGVVTLSGFVRSDAAKQRAVVVAKSVGSVVRVDDQLVVDPEAAKKQGPAESAVDRMISDRVRMALAGDRQTAADARALSIVTQDGVVELSGAVGSAEVKERMVVVAKAVGSVKRVVDRLTVKG